MDGLYFTGRNLFRNNQCHVFVMLLSHERVSVNLVEGEDVSRKQIGKDKERCIRS